MALSAKWNSEIRSPLLETKKNPTQFQTEPGGIFYDRDICFE